MRLRIIFMIIVFQLPVMGMSQVRPRPPVNKPEAAAPPAYLKELKSFDQDGPVTRVVLKNDLTILVAEAHGNPVAEVFMRINAGFGDDPKTLPGVARILERMLLRGTATRKPAALAADLNALGCTVATDTFHDSTIVRLQAPSIQWKRMLEIQADMLLNPELDGQELKGRIEAWSAEQRRERADPELGTEASLLGTGFAGERLVPDLSAPTEALRNLARDRWQSLYRGRYRPDQMLLIVCGDVPTGEVLPAAVGLYAKAKGVGPPAERRQAAVPPEEFRYAQERGRAKLARLLLGFRTVGGDSADGPALDLLAALLGNGEASVLNRRLKREQGLVFDLAVENIRRADAGYLAFRFVLDPKDLDRCEIAAFTEFEILKRQEADEDELTRARAQVERDFWESMGTVATRSDQLARFESLGSWKLSRTYLERLGKVRWADIRRVASRYLALDDCALVESLPEQAEPRSLSAAAVRSTIRDLLAPATAEAMGKREQETVLALDAPAGNEAFTPSEVRYPFQKASILRGPDLFIREDHTIPYIHIGFMFPGGRLMETRSNAGITALLLHTMLQDTKNRDAYRMYRQLELYGARVQPVVADDWFGLRLAISSANVEAGLNLVSEWIKQPILDPDQVARQKKFLRAAIKDRPDSDRAGQMLRDALFDGHPYARDNPGTETSLDAITAEDVRAWYQACVADRKPMVVMIGDTQGTSLAGYFVRNFSGSRFEDVKMPDGFPKALAARAAAEGEASGDLARVLLGFQAPPAGDEDYFAMRVLENYASGPTGRLAVRFQEAAPAAIGVFLKYFPRLRGGFLQTGLETAPDKEDAAVKLLDEEIERIGTAGLTYREYRSAVAGAVGKLQIARQDRYRQIDELILAALLRQGIDEYLEEAGRLQEVKQAALQDVAQRFLKLAKSATIRLHGRSGPDGPVSR